MNGIIPLYKPKGMTSHDCVVKIRKLIKMKKVGHTGTLDPNVEGVLPICVGEATKIIPFVLELKKEYIAEVMLGASTTTEDPDGEIVEKVQLDRSPTNNEIKDVLKEFEGEIIQVAPMYSAVKVDGKRLYEYARQGIEVNRPKRNITIYEMEHLMKDKMSTNESFRIRVLCSKGTYIRTLCVDIGSRLGYPAHMSYLIRTNSDGITLKETVSFSDIKNYLDIGKIDNMLLPLTRGLAHLDVVQVDVNTKVKVLQGQKLTIPQQKLMTENFTMMHGG